MMATINSGWAAPGPGWLALLGWLAAAGLCLADNHAAYLKRAERNYRQARARYQANTNDVEAAWQFGRACFDRADLARDDDEREALAQEGIAGCRHAVEREPKSAPAHYYLAMNLGQLAQTRSLGALRLVGEMEREFKSVRDLDARLDHAGPDRNLGLLYLQAPGWPASIGSRTNARKHLDRAVELAPDYPDNRLSRLEALVKWGDRKSLQRDFKAADEALSRARKELSGEEWEQSWEDWDRRWKKIEEKAREWKK